MKTQTKELDIHKHINLDSRDFRNTSDYHVDAWQEFIISALDLPKETTFVTLWVKTVDYS